MRKIILVLCSLIFSSCASISLINDSDQAPRQTSERPVRYFDVSKSYTFFGSVSQEGPIRPLNDVCKNAPWKEIYVSESGWNAATAFGGGVAGAFGLLHVLLIGLAPTNLIAYPALALVGVGMPFVILSMARGSNFLWSWSDIEVACWGSSSKS